MTPEEEQRTGIFGRASLVVITGCAVVSARAASAACTRKQPAAEPARGCKLAGNGQAVADEPIDLPHAHTVSVDPSTHREYLPLENLNGRRILGVLQGVQSADGVRP